MILLEKAAFALLVASTIGLCSCGPNDDKGSMDQKNSNGEGAVDSTRLTNFDSTSTHNSTDSNRQK